MKTIAALRLMELMMVVAAVFTSTLPIRLWNLIRGLFTIPEKKILDYIWKSWLHNLLRYLKYQLCSIEENLKKLIFFDLLFVVCYDPNFVFYVLYQVWITWTNSCLDSVRFQFMLVIYQHFSCVSTWNLQRFDGLSAVISQLVKIWGVVYEP